MVKFRDVSPETRKKLAPYGRQFLRLVSDSANQDFGIRGGDWSAMIDGGGVVVNGVAIAIGRYELHAEHNSGNFPLPEEIAAAQAIDTVVAEFEKQGVSLFVDVRPLKGESPRFFLQRASSHKHPLRNGDKKLEPAGQ